MTGIQFEKPHSGLRKGQILFNFLEWLGYKGYGSAESVRMADPFNISDSKLDELYDEFLKLQQMRSGSVSEANQADN